MNAHPILFKALLISAATLSTVVVAGSIVAARHQVVIRPNTYVGTVSVGGLTTDEAAKKLRIWWETEKRVPLSISWPGRSVKLPPQTATKLDTVLDDQASVAQLPSDNFWGEASGLVAARTEARMTFDPKYKSAGADIAPLSKLVADNAVPEKPAKVVWDGTELIKRQESTRYKLEPSHLYEIVGQAINTSTDVVLPIESAAPHVTKQDLSQITELVSSFTTHFPARQGNRNNNIKVAASHLNGVVLLPGERLSFNTTVGKRTVEGGFMEAGVYKNGKHDKGIGGGICQVSTTLYNAALLGNFKIRQRQNHSMPVAYVPLGQDATVDYGAIDLVIENNYATPVAVTSAYNAGTLSFRIFGKRDPSLSVKIERERERSWDQAMQIVPDKTLAPGKEKLIEKGSRGHEIYTYRLVFKDGKLVHREALGRSFYRPSVKIVARGVAPAAAITSTAPPSNPQALTNSRVN